MPRRTDKKGDCGPQKNDRKGVEALFRSPPDRSANRARDSPACRGGTGPRERSRGTRASIRARARGASSTCSGAAGTRARRARRARRAPRRTPAGARGGQVGQPAPPRRSAPARRPAAAWAPRRRRRRPAAAARRCAARSRSTSPRACAAACRCCCTTTRASRRSASSRRRRPRWGGWGCVWNWTGMRREPAGRMAHAAGSRRRRDGGARRRFLPSRPVPPLAPPNPRQHNKYLLAMCYWHCNQPYRAVHLLNGASGCRQSLGAGAGSRALAQHRQRVAPHSPCGPRRGSRATRRRPAPAGCTSPPSRYLSAVCSLALRNYQAAEAALLCHGEGQVRVLGAARPAGCGRGRGAGAQQAARHGLAWKPSAPQTAGRPTSRRAACPRAAPRPGPPGAQRRRGLLPAGPRRSRHGARPGRGGVAGQGAAAGPHGVGRVRPALRAGWVARGGRGRRARRGAAEAAARAPRVPGRMLASSTRAPRAREALDALLLTRALDAPQARAASRRARWRRARG
jgi:hypothetical protein